MIATFFGLLCYHYHSLLVNKWNGREKTKTRESEKKWDDCEWIFIKKKREKKEAKDINKWNIECEKHRKKNVRPLKHRKIKNVEKKT